MITAHSGITMSLEQFAQKAEAAKAIFDDMNCQFAALWRSNSILKLQSDIDRTAARAYQEISKALKDAESDPKYIHFEELEAILDNPEIDAREEHVFITKSLKALAAGQQISEMKLSRQTDEALVEIQIGVTRLLIDDHIPDSLDDWEVGSSYIHDGVYRAETCSRLTTTLVHIPLVGANRDYIAEMIKFGADRAAYSYRGDLNILVV